MRFYKYSIDEGRRKKYAYGIGVQILQKYDEMQCNACGRNLRKSVKVENPYVVLTSEHYPDFMYSDVGRLISAKAREVLIKENVSGCTLSEIITVAPKETPAAFQKLLKEAGENVKRMPENPPKYYKFHESAWVPFHEKSQLEVHSGCSVCGYPSIATSPGEPFVKFGHPVYMDQKEWDGSDFFSITQVGTSVCSERFYDIYHEHQLTGLVFEQFPSL